MRSGTIGRSLRSMARSAALFALAGLAFLPGLALLSHAAWVAIAAAQGPAVASLVVGTAWCGVGCALVLVARLMSQPHRAPRRLRNTDFAEAFLTGLALGRAAAGPPRKKD